MVISENDIRKMAKRCVSLLMERNMGTLYHFTCIDSLLHILKTNRFDLNDCGDGTYYMSTTRNKNSVQGYPYMQSDYSMGGGSYHNPGFAGIICRLELDGELLRAYGKIRPFDYIYDAGDVIDDCGNYLNGKQDAMSYKYDPEEMYHQPFSQGEERLISRKKSIPNADKIINRIDVYIDPYEASQDWWQEANGKDLKYLIKKYGDTIDFYDDRAGFDRQINEIDLSGTKEKELINEISTTDAYARFYKDNIPQDVYEALMKGTDKMTPFHKLCLDSIVNYNWGEAEHNYILPHARLIGDKWAEANQDARQLLLRYLESSDIARKGRSFESIAAITEKILGKEGHTESSYRDRGYHVLYENEMVLITCTTSYSASKKYYGDSHWCTASDVFGDYNGYKMFGDYTVDDDSEYDGILIQLVDKMDRGKSIQICIGAGDKRLLAACDFKDNSVSDVDVNDFLSERGVEFSDLIGSIDSISLYKETKKLWHEEYHYWQEKTFARVKKIRNEIEKQYKSGKFDIQVKMALPDAFDNWNEWSDDNISVRIWSKPKSPKDNFLIEVSYYGGHLRAIDDFEDEYDEMIHIEEAILVRQKDVPNTYEFIKRIPNIRFVWDIYDGAVLIALKDGYEAYTPDLEPIAKAEDCYCFRNHFILGPKTLFRGPNENGIRAYVINKETGVVWYDGLIYSLDFYEGSFTTDKGAKYYLN